MNAARARPSDHPRFQIVKTNLLIIFLALGFIGTVPLARAHDDRRDSADRDPRGGSIRDLNAELKHTRGTYNHVLDQLDALGASKHIREEMRHIDAELNHVQDELNTGRIDVEHVRDEIAHIHDELHHVDEELHARGERQPDQQPPRKKGVTIRLPF